MKTGIETEVLNALERRVGADKTTSSGRVQAVVMPWNLSRPPNDVWIEAESPNGLTYTAKAVYGGDGVRAHWEFQDGTCLEPDTFSKWRHIQGHNVENQRRL